ncbi:MAG: hypothetical protein ACK2U1_12135 [Anaerolineales bacterium]|jgi:hypothetical protein
MSDIFPKPNSLILIALIPKPKDLEVVRVLGWYRIPLRTAPKVVSVDYIAFYQPASFGDRKWCIEKFAQVRGHELVSRGELMRNEPDHPKAKDEYFKIQLGQLLELPVPIRAENWKRITFFYTTGQYLLSASTIADLVVHSEERSLLWKSLRERAENKREYEIPDVDLSPDVLSALLGIKEVAEG